MQDEPRREGGRDRIALYPSRSLTPTYPAPGWESYVRYAYEGNLPVYRCVQAIIQSFAASPLRVHRKADDTIWADHPAAVLFRRPNAWQTPYQWWEVFWVHWWLSGNVFVYKVRNGGGKVVELWHLRPDRVGLLPAREGFVEHYIYRIDGLEVPIATGDILHERAYSPRNDYFGQSPLLAGLGEIATDNEARDFTKVMLENRSVAPGVVLFGEKETSLSEDQVRRMREQWTSRYGGDNRGKMALFEGIRDAKVLSLNMREMELPELRSLDEARICAIFGVPPIVAGLKSGLERSTFSNFEEARRAFWQDTIEPFQNRLDDWINAFLLPEFGQDAYTQFDSRDVSALSGLRDARIMATMQGFQAGVYTRNEARERLGLPLLDGGDIFLQPFGIVEREAKRLGAGSDCACGRCLPAATVKTTSRRIGPRSVGLVQGSLGRGREAQKWVGEMMKLMAQEFRWQGDEILTWLGVGKSAAKQGDLLDADLSDEDWEELARVLVAGAVSRLGETIAQQLVEAARLAAEEVGIAFDLDQAPLLQFIEDYKFTFARGISDTSVEDVRGVIRGAFAEGRGYEEMIAELRSKFTDWTELRAEMVARSEVVRASNYGAKEAWRQAGVTHTQWLASSDSCAYCLAMDGKTISINESYFQLGDQLQPDETVPPLKVSYERVDAPPLHPHCGCTEIPVMEDDDV